MLRSLYDLRISADYAIDVQDLVSRDAQAAAEQAIDIAQKAMQMLEYLKSRNK